MREIRSPLDGIPSPFAARAVFSPASLFASGEGGAWYDPSDLSTLFQDAAGTTPVASDGDPVRLMLDKSGNGNHAVAPSDAARPLYKTAGGLHWIEADGVDDVFDMPEIQLGTAALISLGLKQNASSSNGWMPIGGGASALGSDYRSYIWSYDLSNQIIVRMTAEVGGLQKTLSDAPLEDLADHVLTWNRTSGTDMAADLDGVQIASTTTSATANFPVRQILGSYATTYYEPGRLYGAVIRNAATSEDEQGNVEAYLAAKSGITL